MPGRDGRGAFGPTAPPTSRAGQRDSLPKPVKLHVGVRESGANPELTRSGEGDGRGHGHWDIHGCPGKASRSKEPESEDLLAPAARYRAAALRTAGSAHEP